MRIAILPDRYGEPTDPTTDDPLELAVIDAMFAAYMSTAFPANYREVKPGHFWQMVRFIHLTEMARAAIAVMTPQQATLFAAA